MYCSPVTAKEVYCIRTYRNEDNDAYSMYNGDCLLVHIMAVYIKNGFPLYIKREKNSIPGLLAIIVYIV